MDAKQQTAVLLADSMKVNQKIFQAQAAPYGFRIDTAVHTDELAEAAAGCDYRMIFIDANLPDAGGMEAAKLLRGRTDALLILMGQNAPDLSETALAQAGIAAFLKKPVQPERLKALIEHLTGLSPQTAHKTQEGAAQDIGISNGNAQNPKNDAGAKGKSYRRLLEIFASETGALTEMLPVYAKEDREIFRTKVHGIKGTSLHVGRQYLSEFAEVMEMAAKTENDAFIARHIDRFVEELKKTLREIDEELASTAVPAEKNDSEHTAQRAEALFAQMRECFENYDLSGAEACLYALETMTLTPEYEQLRKDAKTACRELEYERGAKLLENFRAESL